jgi:hypothetical protein
MATLSDERVVAELLEKLTKQRRRQSLQFEEVWEYWHTTAKAIRWAVFTKTYFNDLDRSPFVGDRLLLWSKQRGQVAHIGDLRRRLGGTQRKSVR